MQRYWPTSPEERAVAWAMLSQDVVPAQSVKREEYYLQAANRHLQKQGHSPLSSIQLCSIIDTLVKSNLFRDNGKGGYDFMKNPTLGGKLKREWDPAKLVKKRKLNKSLPLTNTFLSRQGEDYTITFNADGKGGIKLPKKRGIVYKNLNALDDDICAERKLQNRAGKGSGHKWYLKSGSLPEVKRDINVQEYLDKFYPEQ